MSDKNWKDIAKDVAEETGITKKKSVEVIGTFLELARDYIVDMDRNVKFRLGPLGMFHIKVNKPRQYRNPKTGEPIQKGEIEKIKFKVNSGLQPK